MTEVKIGDRFKDDFVGEVEVFHVSPYGQIVYRFDDGSVDVAQDIEEMHENNLFLVVKPELSTWINICRAVGTTKNFVDEGMYETRNEAIKYFDTVNGRYELVDTIEVTWSSRNDGNT